MKTTRAAAALAAAALVAAALYWPPSALALAVPAAQAADGAGPPPVTFTAEQDHRNMMEQLGIQALRPGASGDENDPAHANYDELLANPYRRLPDPLRLDDGTKVTTAALWWRQRRPQLVAQLEREVYGRIPADVPQVSWRVSASGRESLGGYPVRYRRLIGHIDHRAYPAIDVAIPVTLVLPAAAAGKVPVLILFWFGPPPVPPSEPDDREAISPRPCGRSITDCSRVNSPGVRMMAATRMHPT
jgi:hypothetical protein